MAPRHVDSHAVRVAGREERAHAVVGDAAPAVVRRVDGATNAHTVAGNQRWRRWRCRRWLNCRRWLICRPRSANRRWRRLRPHFRHQLLPQPCVMLQRVAQPDLVVSVVGSSTSGFLSPKEVSETLPHHFRIPRHRRRLPRVCVHVCALRALIPFHGRPLRIPNRIQRRPQCHPWVCRRRRHRRRRQARRRRCRRPCRRRHLRGRPRHRCLSPWGRLLGCLCAAETAPPSLTPRPHCLRHPLRFGQFRFPRCMLPFTRQPRRPPDRDQSPRKFRCFSGRQRRFHACHRLPRQIFRRACRTRLRRPHLPHLLLLPRNPLLLLPRNPRRLPRGRLPRGRRLQCRLCRLCRRMRPHRFQPLRSPPRQIPPPSRMRPPYRLLHRLYPTHRRVHRRRRGRRGPCHSLLGGARHQSLVGEQCVSRLPRPRRFQPLPVRPRSPHPCHFL